MPIPDYETIMLPLLQYASDGQVHKFSDACDHLAKHFRVTEEELRMLLPSGKYYVFRSRVGWAKTYLTKALLLESSTKANFSITQTGFAALKQNPPKIDSEFLSQYPAFLEFLHRSNTTEIAKSRKPKDSGKSSQLSQGERTPEELLEYAHLELRRTLTQDLLKQIEQSSPRFFETLVLDLLVAMGYGGSIEDAAELRGKVGDEGIDGTIKQDRLGLDTIYVQAKRWKNTTPVSRTEIQKFVGALKGFHASKGVFITTGRFADTASGYVENLDVKVILINGDLLAKYMIDFNIGVSLKQNYEVKKIDSDYFIEE